MFNVESYTFLKDQSLLGHVFSLASPSPQQIIYLKTLNIVDFLSVVILFVKTYISFFSLIIPVTKNLLSDFIKSSSMAHEKLGQFRRPTSDL